MIRLQTAHTADLGAATLATAQDLMRVVFPDDFSDADWDNTIGGMHALVWDGDDLIAHASVVQRRLLHGGRALRTGYVEGVGVHPDRRGQGHGATVMGEIERIIRGGYALGGLSATAEAISFYAARGWRLWQGPIYALSPERRVRTADDDGSVLVLPVTVSPDLTGALTCDWREGEVW